MKTDIKFYIGILFREENTMYNLYKFFKWISLILCALILLAACSRLTQQNFDEIQPGMSMQAVVSILGEPTSSQTINFGGLSGTSADWKTKSTDINIIFVNDKVQIKS